MIATSGAEPGTLQELLGWLADRVRWLRDWHQAPEVPKPIHPKFREAILEWNKALAGCLPDDSDQAMQVWRFMEHSIHEAHRLLDSFELYDAPVWPSPDPTKDPRVLISALAHLEVLRTFVAQRIRERMPQVGRKRKRPTKRLGKPTERTLIDYLETHPEADIDEVIRATGLAEGKIRRTATWHEQEETLLRQYLEKHPEATTSDIQSWFTFSPAKTCKMQAWKDHLKKKKETKAKNSEPQQLTRKMLATRPDHKAPDPSDAIDRRDSLFQAIIEAADPTTRGSLNKLKEPERNKLLDHVLEQCGGDDPDGPFPDANVMVEVSKSWIEDREQEKRHRRGFREREE